MIHISTSETSTLRAAATSAYFKILDCDLEQSDASATSRSFRRTLSAENEERPADVNEVARPLY